MHELVVRCLDRALVAFPPPVRSLELLAYRDRMPVEVMGKDGTLVPPTDWGSVAASACTRIRVDRPPLDEFLAAVRRGDSQGGGSGQGGRGLADELASCGMTAASGQLVDMD